MAEKQSPERKGGHTVDLSSDKKGNPKKKKPKGFAPVVQQTINLSTQKEEPAEPTSPSTSKESAPAKPAKKKESRKHPSQGNSLADLIDPETLAKLRG